MHQHIKEKWVTALRSGEFAQCSSFLETEDGFCCLGVLSWLAFQEGVVTREVEGGDIYYDREVEGGEVYHLPIRVARWAGLGDNRDPYVITDGTLLRLSDLNDHGTSFDRIADLIETQEFRDDTFAFED